MTQTSPPGFSTQGYRYSYSGADAQTFVWFGNAPSLISRLESVHTVSVSVHEAKGQARALGYRGIKGLARGVRTIAGSLILTVVNDHPLRALVEQYSEAFPSRSDPLGWSLDREMVGVGSFLNNYALNTRLAVLLPPFNLAMQYVSETAPPEATGRGARGSAQRPEGAGWMLVGVEFIDEGQVTSVNDIVTEMTFSFIAFDFKPLARYDSISNAIAAAGLHEYDSSQQLSLIEALENGGEVSVGREEGDLEALSFEDFNPRRR